MTREEAIYALSAVLALNGISVVAAGEKFLLVSPFAQKKKIANLLSQQGPVDYLALTNTFPFGSLQIRSADLNEIAAMYGELSGRQVKISAGLPRIELGLRAQNPLTAGELIRALDLLLGLRDLKVIQREAGASLELVLQPDEAERDAH